MQCKENHTDCTVSADHSAKLFYKQSFSQPVCEGRLQVLSLLNSPEVNLKFSNNELNGPV